MSTMNPIMTVIGSQGPFRFVECGTLEINGMPDYRLQEKDFYTGRYHDIYLFDNGMQMTTCLEDPEYTKWLAGHPCYVKDTVRNLHV